MRYFGFICDVMRTPSLSRALRTSDAASARAAMRGWRERGWEGVSLSLTHSPLSVSPPLPPLHPLSPSLCVLWLCDHVSGRATSQPPLFNIACTNEMKANACVKFNTTNTSTTRTRILLHREKKNIWNKLIASCTFVKMNHKTAYILWASLFKRFIHIKRKLPKTTQEPLIHVRCSNYVVSPRLRRHDLTLTSTSSTENICDFLFCFVNSGSPSLD